MKGVDKNNEKDIVNIDQSSHLQTMIEIKKEDGEFVFDGRSVDTKLVAPTLVGHDSKRSDFKNQR